MDIGLHQATERNPATDDINHNFWDGYAMTADKWAISAILVFFWIWGNSINPRRRIMSPLRQTLQKVNPQRVQHWVDEVRWRFAGVGAFTDSVQGAWQWLLSRFEPKSQHTSKSDQDLPLSKHHQFGIETRLWPINRFYGMRGQDPHSFILQATWLFILFMISAICLHCWFLLKVYSMLVPPGYAFQIWAIVSSVISSTTHSTITCLSLLLRCTETAYHNHQYPDGSYIPLTTPPTFTESVCRQIESYIIYLRTVVVLLRGIPLPGIGSMPDVSSSLQGAIMHIRSAKCALEYTTRSARHYIGCLLFFIVVSDC
jgi:hypothetical protein